MKTGAYLTNMFYCDGDNNSYINWFLWDNIEYKYFNCNDDGTKGPMMLWHEWVIKYHPYELI